jgi:hypothetical protein
LEQEDIKWRQRAKENWLRFGDRNSKFFHTCANQKHRSSRISSIKDKNGELCTTKEGGIEGAFVDYFNELFKSGENLKVAVSCLYSGRDFYGPPSDAPAQVPGSRRILFLFLSKKLGYGSSRGMLCHPSFSKNWCNG